MEIQFEYGNWVRKKLLLRLGLAVLGLGALALLPLGFLYRAIMLVLFVIAFLSFLFPLYAYVMFSQRGGRFQEKVYQLIIQCLGTARGKILDIGSGNGVLAVKLAQQLEGVEVTGVDYWGRDWEYSKQVCERNAQVGGVASRVQFQKGDAAALEFASETFDGAISNLTFHEVQAVADKRQVLQEALRVVKPGGRFAFVDYFYEAKFYGKTAEFEAHLKGFGLSQFELRPLSEVIPIPILLRHLKIVGKAGILYGQK